MVGKVSKCRSCGADIIWALNDNGVKTPLNAKRAIFYKIDKTSETVVQHYGHINHFITCPQRDKWRKKP